ncbi:MAG: hypothetical protein ABF976_11610 [Acetobacter syzygii]|uniref:hypothetical protein n=1 Tax=Acetobacteraceae TaxID=433 RepID=UPI0039EBD7F6
MPFKEKRGNPDQMPVGTFSVEQKGSVITIQGNIPTADDQALEAWKTALLAEIDHVMSTLPSQRVKTDG